MRHELVLVGAHTGHLVLHEWHSSTTVEEIDRDCPSTAVGRSEFSIEVGSQVHSCAIDVSWGENTGDSDANVGLGVIADGHGVDDEGQELVLVRWSVLLQ